MPCGLAVHSLAVLPAAQPAGGAGTPALVFAAGRDGGLHGYGAGGTRDVSLATAHAGRVWSVATVPASAAHPALLASASADCTVRLWHLAPPAAAGDAPSIERWARLRGHCAPVHAVIPYGVGLLASGGEDCTVSR